MKLHVASHVGAQSCSYLFLFLKYLLRAGSFPSLRAAAAIKRPVQKGSRASGALGAGWGLGWGGGSCEYSSR